MLDFVADIADVVVAEVVVDADPRRGAEAHEETQGETERTWWKVEGDPGVEVPRTGDDDHDDGDDRADPERHGDGRDRRKPPVEERQVGEPDDRHDQHRLARRNPLPEVAKVLREADVAGRDLEGAAEHELPDEEKAHQPAHALRAIAPAQIPERSAGSRQRRPELAPHHTVAQHHHQRDEPAEHRLRAAQRGHEERDRDERSDPDHVRHVQRRSVDQTEAALHQTLIPPGAIRATYRPRPVSPEGSCSADRPARWNAESISSTVNTPNSCTSVACRIPSTVSIVYSKRRRETRPSTSVVPSRCTRTPGASAARLEW